MRIQVKSKQLISQLHSFSLLSFSLYIYYKSKMGCGGSVPEREEEKPIAPTSPAVKEVARSTTPKGDPPPYPQDASRRSQRQMGQYLRPWDHCQPLRLVEADPDRATLINALDHMGQYLDQRGQMACGVTAGGLVTTIYLQTKKTTRDINFFTDQPHSHQTWNMEQAASSAARASGGTHGVPLAPNWCTNASQILRDRGIGNQLMMEAQQQNTIVYQYRGQRGGLILYAAPWAYAFCGKLERLCEADQSPHDINDAVLYLHEYLRNKNRSGLSTTEVAKMCREYRKDFTDAALHHVNIQYYHIYGQQIIYR